MKTIAYLRVSTVGQTVQAQEHEIKNYSEKNSLIVNEFYKVEMSSRKSPVLRRMKELESQLNAGDVLISVELSRLGRNLAEVVQFIDDLLIKKVRIILINNGIDTGKKTDSYAQANLNLQIGMFALMARLERDLISIRTKEGLLAAKEEGRIGGRREGVLMHSKYDKHLPKIKEYLALGLKLDAIIKLIKEGKVNSLSLYLQKRGIRAKKNKHHAK